MSQSRNKYVNSNLNGVLSSQKAGTSYQQPYTQAPRYGSGLVSLGSAKVSGFCGKQSLGAQACTAGWQASMQRDAASVLVPCCASMGPALRP
jgi:hypothetical protein